jgi:2'-5' RNA ligase
MRGRRIFLAIDIPAAARDVCAGYIENLGSQFPKVRVAWVRPEKLHITLKFLGDTTDDVMRKLRDDIVRVVAEHEQFQSSLAGTGIFSSRSRPRVLWLGVDDSEARMRKIHHSLEMVCREFGYDADDKLFTPHITVGRIREPRSAVPLADRHLKTEIEPVAFSVSEIVLYESKTERTGSVYSRLLQIPLEVD